MKKIKQNEFCFLAKSELFLTWLKGIDEAVYADLVKFLMEGHTCGDNRLKMIEILKYIQKNQQWAKSLEEFITKNYPAMIVDDSNENKSRVISRAIDNKHRVFSYYDPTLATFPRRIILSGNDLQKQVRDFCSKQFYYESIVVEDRAYIEYVPQGISDLIKDIPEKNWQIRAYKKKFSV